MPYELFVGWRYLYSPRRSAGLWLLLGLGVLSAMVGLGLFYGGIWRAVGAVALIGGTAVIAFALMLMVFSAFTAISVLGLAIGVAILIWVLSVTSGFQDAFRQKVLGVNAHVLVLKYGLDFTEYREVIEKAESLPEVRAAAPFVFHQMMIAKGNRLSGVLVKGVDPDRVTRVLDLHRHIESPPHETRRQDSRDLLTTLEGARGAKHGHTARADHRPGASQKARRQSGRSGSPGIAAVHPRSIRMGSGGAPPHAQLPRVGHLQFWL